MTNRCDQCEYWQDHMDDDYDTDIHQGNCRRYPPVHLGLPEDDERDMVLEWNYPVTRAFHWCGEWKQKQKATR